jgi:Regulator of ribonuclease activity B
LIYPDDDNGDVLRRLEAQGDDLSRPRNIDFTLVFPEESAAERFADHFREQGFAVSIEFAETVKELPWDVVVVKHMTPSHQGISDFETNLQRVADALGGRNDGWGCFSEPDSRST